MKRLLLLSTILVSTAVLQTPAQQSRPVFSVVEMSVADMQKAMRDKRVTSKELVTQYLARIAMYEDKLNAVISVNPNAIKEAEQLDRERAQGKIRGSLHGIPVALKDNIHTTNMPTSGGALAFDGYTPPYEATLVRNLKDAGAVIIAKTGLSELANFVAGAPTAMPGNYNAVGGQGYNPYDPRRDPREATADGRPALGTGGSSSGIGTAANFWALNVGTETSGSILSPSNANMLAAVKPTVGRVSRYGVIPITADQDTAGPMGKNVSDVAILLGALESPAADPNDPATTRCTPPPNRDYTPFLRADGLKGARIGIPRANFYDPITLAGETQPRGGLTPAQAKVMADAIDVLKKQGAIIVDPVDIPSISSKDPNENLLLWGSCGGAEEARGRDEKCSVVLKYGMKRDFNLWLKTLGASAPVKSLTELRDWNLAHRNLGAIKYNQSRLDISDEMDVARDKARYEADRAKDIRLGGTNGIDAAMKANNLDALLFPAANGANIAARPGYPTVLVPFGMAPNEPTPPFPADFKAKPSPFGVSFTGTACSEAKLLTLGYAFEQASKKRVPPASAP